MQPVYSKQEMKITSPAMHNPATLEAARLIVCARLSASFILRIAAYRDELSNSVFEVLAISISYDGGEMSGAPQTVWYAALKDADVK